MDKDVETLVQVLRQSRDFFKILVDSCPCGMALTDDKGNVLVGNVALAKLLKIPVTNLKKVNLLQIFKLPEKIFLLLKNELSLSFSILLKEFLCTISLYLRPEAGIYWLIQDIKEVVILRRRYFELAESLPVGVFKADRKGKIIYLNQAGKDILGLRTEPNTFLEVIGKKNWRRLTRNLFQKKEKLNYCIKIGDERFLNFSLKIFEEEENEEIILGIFEDISKERRLKEKLNRALIEAEAANRAKTLFLAKMSHELRTPLNTILGMAALLEPLLTTPQAKEFLKDLKSSAEYLTELIGTILDFSKIESGKLELKEENFDLFHLFSQIKEAFEPLIDAKKLSFIYVFDSSLPRWVKGDPVRIKQIVHNLLENSLKFTEEGEIELKVSYQGKRRERYWIRIEVRDTGCGIPEDKIEKIFEPFEQTEEGQKRGGTGLGLALVKELVHLMGGKLYLKTQLGRGTIFIIKLPLKEGAVPQKEIEEKVSPLQNKKALIVDDVPLNRKVLRYILENQNWKVKEANNGKEALEILKKQEFDVIFLDLSMPVMDGWETIKKIKNSERLKKIPVIALTAHALVGDKEKCLNAGFDGYLSKPLQIEKLWQEVKKVLKIESKEEKKEIQQKPKEEVVVECNLEEIPDFNWEELVKTCQGIEELALELLQDLVREGKEWIKEAEEAVKAGDPMRIRKICHLIRGSASTVTARRFEESAKLLGKFAREGKLEKTPQALEELKKAYYSLEKKVSSLSKKSV